MLTCSRSTKPCLWVPHKFFKVVIYIFKLIYIQMRCGTRQGTKTYSGGPIFVLAYHGQVEGSPARKWPSGNPGVPRAPLSQQTRTRGSGYGYAIGRGSKISVALKHETGIGVGRDAPHLTFRCDGGRVGSKSPPSRRNVRRRSCGGQ